MSTNPSRYPARLTTLRAQAIPPSNRRPAMRADEAIMADSNAAQKVILLMGMPRSGTTWLGKIFDSHPDTLYRHEPDRVRRIEAVPLLAEAAHAESYRTAINEFAASLPYIRVTKVTSTLPIFPKRYYSRPQLLVRRLSILAAKLGARLVGELPVPEVVDNRTLAGLPIVWKSIESLGRLGVLCRILPASPSVLILRHPCGYIASVLRGESMGRLPTRTLAHEDYGVYEMLLETEQARRHGLTIDQIRRMPRVARLAWRWVLFNEKAMDDTEGLAHCTVVRYEDVCRDPQAQARKLFDCAGLRWNDQTETFIRRSTASEHNAYYSIFKDPLKSAYKWKNELEAADIERAVSVVRDSKPGKLYAESD